MAERLLIGTASWTDKPLIASGKFYPPGVTKAEELLRYYVTQFPLVEADTTYYALPSPYMVRNWVERTPEGFTFDVKAYSLFTEHPTAVARMPKAVRAMLPEDLAEKRRIYRKDAPKEVIDRCWSSFIDGLWPLYEAEKLGVIVFQFPRWVFPNRATKSYFEEIRERLGPFRAAVEFRNDVWMNAENREETLAVLGDLDFTYICVDEPQGFRSSVPPIAAATNRLGFVRFHGRNVETWEQRGGSAAERFDYWYEPDEFDEWTPKIEDLAAETEEVHLVMNTNNYDQGPTNARLLAERLHAAGMEPAAPPASTPA